MARPGYAAEHGELGDLLPEPKLALLCVGALSSSCRAAAASWSSIDREKRNGGGGWCPVSLVELVSRRRRRVGDAVNFWKEITLCE